MSSPYSADREAALAALWMALARKNGMPARPKSPCRYVKLRYPSEFCGYLWRVFGQFVAGPYFSSLTRKSSDLFECPNVIRNPRFHGRRHPQRLVNPSEVVVHEVQRHSMLQVVHFL